MSPYSPRRGQLGVMSIKFKKFFTSSERGKEGNRFEKIRLLIRPGGAVCG